MQTSDPKLSLTRTALLAAPLVLLMILRGWPLITAPQLWAEEGWIYLNHALERPAADMLTAAFKGYYQILSNLPAVVAAKALDPVNYADLFVAVSALATALTLWVIVTARSAILPDPADRWLTAAALLAFAPNEVFLNTINLHFFLPVAVWMLLGVRRLGPWQIAFLALAFLHGVTSLFLAPFFVLRFWSRRARADLIVCIVAVACLAVQLSAFVATDMGGERHFNLDQIPRIFAALRQNAVDGFTAALPLPGGGVAAGLVIALYAGLAGRALATGRRDVLVYGPGAAAGLLILMTLSLPDMQGGGRYALVFSAIQIGLILSIWRGWPAVPVRALVALWLLVQAVGTFPPSPSEIGSWRQELARSATLDARVVRIRPVGWWSVELRAAPGG
ncbi:MAG: hypothetical protein AAF501_02890 [Pseudomonadota bacterium]